MNKIEKIYPDEISRYPIELLGSLIGTFEGAWDVIDSSCHIYYSFHPCQELRKALSYREEYKEILKCKNINIRIDFQTGNTDMYGQYTDKNGKKEVEIYFKLRISNIKKLKFSIEEQYLNFKKY